MNKLKSLVASVTLCTIAIFSANAQAQDVGVEAATFNGGDGSYQRAVDEGITLIVAPDAPYSFVDEKTKEYSGIDVDIFREVLKRLKIKNVKWELAQFDALIPSLLAKRADIIAENLHENPKRLAIVTFTSPAYWYGSALVVAKENPLKIETWEDLAGKTIGTIRGSANHQMLEQRTDLKELKLYTSNESEIADLAAGRLDAALEDDLKIGLLLKAQPDAGIEFATGYKAQTSELGYARFALRKEDVDLNHAVSRTIDEIRADGTLGKILVNYGFTLRNLWNFPITAE